MRNLERSLSERALESTIPPPQLDDGGLIETEDGVIEVKNGQLHKILDPRELVVAGRPPEDVTFLPASLSRRLYYTGERE